MSASPEVLSGDFMEVYKVENVGVTGSTDPADDETETLLGHTHDEITLSKDNEEVELQAHEQAATIRKRTHYSMDFDLSVFVTPGIPELETLGLVDANGDATNNPPEWECARIYVYDVEPSQADSTTPQTVVELYWVAWDFDEMSFSPGDPGAVDFTAYVNGSWKNGKTPLA